MPFLIRSSNGQRTVIPVGVTRQVDPDSIRADLIEALKGLTIKFELKISDVLADDNAISNKVATCNGTHDENECRVGTNSNDMDASTPSAIPTTNGHSVEPNSPVTQVINNGIEAAAKSIYDEINMKYSPPKPPKADSGHLDAGKVKSAAETKPSLKDVTSQRPHEEEMSCHREKAIDDNSEIMHPNLRPRLVNEFRSSIKPVSSLESDSITERPRAKLNFTPLQVLKKQAESQVVKPQVRNGTRRPTFVDPIGDNYFPKRPMTPGVISPSTSASPPQHDKKHGQTNGLHKEPQTNNSKSFEQPINEPIEVSTHENKVNENVVIEPATPPTVIQPVAEPICEPVKRAITRGRLKIGSTIKTCHLSDDTKVDPPITYITYDGTKILELTEMLCELASEIELLPKLRSVNVHDLVFAKSAEDGTWYRAMVREVKGAEVDVYYLDWGLSETLDLDRVRYLSDSRMSLVAQPACALKVKFTNGSSVDLEEIFLKEFWIKVESFDEFDDTYTVTLVC